jgi:hypothetical protein
MNSNAMAGGALVVSIPTPETETDLYNIVETLIGIPIIVSD